MARFPRKILWGVLLIIAGSFLLLNNIGFLNIEWDMLTVWPWFFIVGGILCMIFSYPKIHSGVFWTLSGIILLLWRNDFFYPYDFYDLFPLIFVCFTLASCIQSFVPTPHFSNFLTSLALLIPSVLWVLNNTIWYHQLQTKALIGIFLVFLGIRIILQPLIKKKS